MKYPSDDEIVDPAPKLPPEVAAQLAPYVEDARRQYSRFRLRFRKDISVWEEGPAIFVDLAGNVFKKLVVLALRDFAADFQAFRKAVGWEGGAAEIALRYAHFVHKDVTRGRMLFVWQWEKIEPRLGRLIDDAEDVWRVPDAVPTGWASFLAGGTVPAPSPPLLSPDASVGPEDAEALRESRARSRKAFIEPVLKRKGWSQLDFADEAKVDHKTVGAFLNGANVYPNTRLKLAQALEVPVERLPE